MKHRIAVLSLLLALMVSPSLAQLGNGVVYDPTNYHNAVLRYLQLQKQLQQLQQSYNVHMQQYQLVLAQTRQLQNMSGRYRAVPSPWSNLSASNTLNNTSRWVNGINTGTYGIAQQGYSQANRSLSSPTGVNTYDGGKFPQLVPSANVLVISLAQTSDSRVWMGTRDAGLYYTNEGKISAATKELPDTKINTLLPIDQELWIGTDNGLAHWNGREFLTAGLPAPLEHVQVLSLVRDADANIWIGSAKGLLRMNADGISVLEESGNGSPKGINAIFEDRERNLWIGSSQGIERLRDSPFITYSASKDPTAAPGGTIYVDDHGRKWLAPSDGGLRWEKGQQVGYIKNDSLDHDVVYSLTGNQDELWIGRQRGGLTHLVIKDGNVSTQTYTESSGLAQNTIYAVAQSRDGTVWAGSINRGVTKLKDGKLTTYTAADGLASNQVTSILESSDGTMWFATSSGLSSFSQGHWKTYGGLAGLPPGRVNCLFEDSKGVVWIGTDYGPAILSAGQVQVTRDVPGALHEPVLGIAADRDGSLWLATSNQILRVDRDKLLDGTISEADVREFGPADGLQSVEGLKRDRTIRVDPAGRIWFSTYGGLSVVDPNQARDDTVPALVHIEGVTADDNVLDLPDAPFGT